MFKRMTGRKGTLQCLIVEKQWNYRGREVVFSQSFKKVHFLCLYYTPWGSFSLSQLLLKKAFCFAFEINELRNKQCEVILHFSTGQNLWKKISRKNKY